MSIVKKKKHVSKKGKKAWRKHCDIRDVEDFLEDQRLDERLGKFDTKPDEEIFVIDTAGDQQEEKDEKPQSAKAKKRAKLSSGPKCYEILQPDVHSKVPDPNAKRNIVNPVGTKPSALSKLTEKRRLAKGILKKKVVTAKKNRKMAKNQIKKIQGTRENFKLDIWGQDSPEAKGIPSTLVDDFISTEAQQHNILPERRLRSKPPLAKTVVTRAAVEPPHPGVSYNPSFKEHQALLQEVVSHEAALMKRHQRLLRRTTGMFSKVTTQEKEDQWRAEMSTGLPKPDKPGKPDAASDSDTDGQIRSVNPPVKNKKKDHKARRKQREQLLEKERLKRAKIDKKKITDIYKLRKLQSNISSTEKKQSSVREQRAQKRAARAAVADPALNRHKTPARDPDYVDPSQLSGNLANLTSNTNLLRERFESLQRRGALAASKLMMKKKRRVKSYFKPGHKVTDQEIEKYINKRL